MNENEFFYEQPLMQVIKTKFDIPITSNESNFKHKNFQPYKFDEFKQNKPSTSFIDSSNQSDLLGNNVWLSLII